MSLTYTIRYQSKNHYESPARGASWQFLILPEDNRSQQLIDWNVANSLAVDVNVSIKGLGFKTIRIQANQTFTDLEIDATFIVQKEERNPFGFIPNADPTLDYEVMATVDFQADHETELRKTPFTTLPVQHHAIFSFDRKKNTFDNLRALNTWVYHHLFFKVDVTDVNTPLEEIIMKRHGVCQDFTHLFLAISRQHNVPARYVSGYLHQGNGYFGDSQMHAWVEAFVPNGGWIGFDPTNNILAAQNHIKVCHGIDYNDCAPLKGVVYAEGGNTTSHIVEVIASQQ